MRVLEPRDLAAYRAEKEERARRPRFFVGVDLGQSSDYTAIAICQNANLGEELYLDVRHLERFRGRLYPDVAAHVGALMDSPELKGTADLVIDATGVGPAVTDIFTKLGRSFRAVKIHGGDTESFSEGVYRVPKRNLVASLQVMLQTGRFRIARELGLAGTLREELMNFRIKVNPKTAHDSYEAWREGDHDDLVLAAALAAWAAEKEVRDRGQWDIW